MREDYKKYTKTMEKVLSVLERCFDNPNCVIHEGELSIMYISYEMEVQKIYITVKDIDFEFSSFDNAVNFLVGYMGG